MPGAEAPSEPMNAATGGARPRVTVVIPSYNGERLLPGCLDALARQADNALDEVAVGIRDRAENHDVAALRLASKQTPVRQKTFKRRKREATVAVRPFRHDDVIADR